MILYIAHRGEIARRIIRSAKKLGFETAVGYSKHDRGLPFMEEADQAFLLEGETLEETYLNLPLVLETCKKAGAQFFHPGSEFLALNMNFIDTLADAGVRFIGSSSAAMFLLQDEEASKNFAKGILGEERVAASEADRVRQIEVQILADHHGHFKVFGERECTLRSGSMKIIMEAPCFALDDKLRQTIYSDSERVAREAGFNGVGSAEWIWDGPDDIRFLRFTPRLQIGHPATEMVYKTDLVEWQIRVALGESIEGLNPQANGCSFGALILAQDPTKEFAQSHGKIHRLQLPQGVRADFAYREKNEITPLSDRLLGQIVVWDATREGALTKVTEALKKTAILGPATNRGYLIALLEHPAVANGELLAASSEKIRFSFSVPAALEALRGLVKMGNQKPDFYSPANVIDPETHGIYYEDFGGVRYIHTEFADWAIQLGEK